MVQGFERKRGYKVETQEKIRQLTQTFAASSQMLAAMGDETRQHLILEMIKSGKCHGIRVGEITQRTNLSRPAVSHHLRILKDAGIVKVRKEGTRNFYFFDPEAEAFDRLISTLQLAKEILEELPDRHGE